MEKPWNTVSPWDMSFRLKLHEVWKGVRGLVRFEGFSTRFVSGSRRKLHFVAMPP